MPIWQVAPGRWRVQVSLGTDPSGKSHYAEKRVQGTKRDAEKVYAKLLANADERRAAVKAGELRSKGTAKPTTVAEAIERHYATHTPLSPKARRQNVQTMRSRVFAIPIGDTTFGELPLATVRPEHIGAVIRHLQDRNLAPSTVQSYRSQLSRVFRTAVENRWCPENPTTTVTPPKSGDVDYNLPDIDTFKAAMAVVAADRPDLALFMRLAAASGARAAEILALQWGDIDWNGHAVRITKAMTRGKNNEYQIGATKTRRNRTVKLGPTMLSQLADHWKRTPLDQHHAEAFVFPGEKPHLPCGESCMRQAWDHRRHAVGLPKLKIKNLRHFSASVALDGGASVPEVSARLGHANPRVTMQVYSHVIRPDDSRSAAITDGLV